jgi:hypothetical protein
MAMPVLVTGDDNAIPVTLKKNGATFVISAGATIKAQLVSLDHKTTYSPVVEVNKATPGTDLSKSLVVAVFAPETTSAIVYQGKALLEIQVDDSGKKTWFPAIEIRRGNIA